MFLSMLSWLLTASTMCLILAAPLAEDVNLSSLAPISSKDSSTAMMVSHDGSLQATADQTWVQRTIRATYYYSCPNAPNKIRYFEWHAGYDIPNQRIYIHGVADINHVDPIDTSHAPSFATRWYGTLCKEYATVYCYYTFSGRTEGTVAPYGITMFLVTDSNIESERPYVRENCFPRFAGATTCPADPQPSFSTCTIQHIIIGVGH